MGFPEFKDGFVHALASSGADGTGHEEDGAETGADTDTDAEFSYSPLRRGALLCVCVCVCCVCPCV